MIRKKKKKKKKKENEKLYIEKKTVNKRFGFCTSLFYFFTYIYYNYMSTNLILLYTSNIYMKYALCNF